MRTRTTIFDLQVTLMLPIKFQVNWTFGSGEEAKNRFSRWLPRGPSRNWDQNNLNYFLIYKSPRCFLPSFKSIGLWDQEKRKIHFQNGCHGGNLGFQAGTILWRNLDTSQNYHHILLLGILCIMVAPYHMTVLTLILLNPDMRCLTNSINPDQIASAKLTLICTVCQLVREFVSRTWIK